MSDFLSWPLAKQYLASHYFLSEEKPITISEAQRAQLGALHLYVSNGPWRSDLTLAELDRCTLAEKRKRIDEWKKVGNVSKASAMRVFIDFISNLFPSWTRYKRLYTDFQLEWEKIRLVESVHPPKAEDKLPVIKTRTPKEPRSMSPRLEAMIKQSKKINASRSIDPVTFNRLKLQKSPVGNKHKPPPVPVQEIDEDASPYKKTKLASSLRKYRGRKERGPVLQKFVEDLQSYKAGNMRRTSATKMPEGGRFLEVQENEIVIPKKKPPETVVTGNSTVMHQHIKERLAKLDCALGELEKDLDE